MKRRLLGLLLAGLMVTSLAPIALLAQEDNPNVDEITIPEGTEFKLQLHSTVNSKTSHEGDRILSTLIDPVSVEDRDVLPKGVRIDGHIGEVQAARRRGRGGYLTIVFDTVELPNGQKVAILGSLTEVFSSESGSDPTVGVEGELKGRGASRKTQLIMIAAPAAAGAIRGPGTAIAAAAAGMVAALVLPKGKQASLEAGSLVGMRLDRDVTIALPASAQ
jgi:hypothetical protein